MIAAVLENNDEETTNENSDGYDDRSQNCIYSSLRNISYLRMDRSVESVQLIIYNIRQHTDYYKL